MIQILKQMLILHKGKIIFFNDDFISKAVFHLVLTQTKSILSGTKFDIIGTDRKLKPTLSVTIISGTLASPVLFFLSELSLEFWLSLFPTCKTVSSPA